MSRLELKSEILNRVIEGKNISNYELVEIYNYSTRDSTELFEASQELRNKFKRNYVTFSKKAFFNIVNLCKDTCSYCTYKAEPYDQKVSLMSKSGIRELLQLAKKYHCVEALFVTGERPEQKYKEARTWLKKNGFSTTAEYLAFASEMALEEGLFPHTNGGNLTREELVELKKTNVSIGLMLENISDRLTKKDMPHHLAASKKPKERLEVLKNAGILGIPTTTGILIGIGETIEEIIESILAIKELHKKYGHIQEIILQNFHPKPDTRMSDFPSAHEGYFKIIVALARIIIPEMNIQIPPNLSPKSYHDFLSIGINDWGGISPLTPDFVNPEFSWPDISKIEKDSKDAGYQLKCRFPVYPEFMNHVDKSLREKMEPISKDGLVSEEYWK